MAMGAAAFTQMATALLPRLRGGEFLLKFTYYFQNGCCKSKRGGYTIAIDTPPRYCMQRGGNAMQERQEKYDVTGMTCAACSSRVEKCVSALPGMEQVTVNLLKNSMVVKYDSSVLNSDGIVAAGTGGVLAGGIWRGFAGGRPYVWRQKDGR